MKPEQIVAASILGLIFSLGTGYLLGRWHAVRLADEHAWWRRLNQQAKAAQLARWRESGRAGRRGGGESPAARGQDQ
jgi:hypothetical protein